MLNDIIFIGLLILLYFYWFKAQKAKEIAFNAVQERCLQSEIQLLDSYVALKSLRLARDEKGKIRIQRSFTFEFSSTGDDRYNGTAILMGDKLQSIYMQPHRIQ